MKNFFSGRGFKILCTAVGLLLVLSILFVVIGNWIAPQSQLISTITTPFREAGAYISENISRAFTAIGRLDTLEDENNQLREEIRLYREQLLEYEDHKRENEYFKQFLGIKEQHSDFTFQPATVIAREATDAASSFSIDVGSNDGVAVNDPVITPDGLVGYISQVGAAMSTVTTVLDPKIRVGALINRTRESGVIGGDTALMSDGCCGLSYLSGSSAVTIGDFVVTSGEGGVFPAGLMIGTVSDVRKDASNVSIYGVVKTAADVSTVTQVMVITHFEGQGGIAK